MTAKNHMEWQTIPVNNQGSDLICIEQLVFDEKTIVAQLWKHNTDGFYSINYYNSIDIEGIEYKGTYEEMKVIAESICKDQIKKGELNMQDQKQLTFVNMSKGQAKQAGYPTWNDCNHYTVDMSHLQSSTDDWMNTISIKLPNGNAITVCVMQTSKDETCVDTAFHGSNIKNHRAMGFGGEGRDETMHNKNIYAIIATANEIK